MSQPSSDPKAETYHVFPVGHVRRDNGRTVLDILPPFTPALKELEHFSHVQVFWWFSQFADHVYRQITQSEHAPYGATHLAKPSFRCVAPPPIPSA